MVTTPNQLSKELVPQQLNNNRITINSHPLQFKNSINSFLNN